MIFIAQGPPPGSYSSLESFKKSKSTKSFSFGISRDAYANVYQKGNLNTDKQIPGPGTYNTVQEPGKDQVKYTLHSRVTFSDMFQSPTKEVPGPGSYQPKSTMSKTGNYFNSKF